jgi:hypothetical protein
VIDDIDFRGVFLLMVLVGAVLSIPMLFFAEGEGVKILSWAGGLLLGAAVGLWAMDA